jgi:hypothetical protein
MTGKPSVLPSSPRQFAVPSLSDLGESRESFLSFHHAATLESEAAIKGIHKTAQLGELVVAVFDEAPQYGTDPEEVSRTATLAVMHIFRRARGQRHRWGLR